MRLAGRWVTVIGIAAAMIAWRVPVTAPWSIRASAASPAALHVEGRADANASLAAAGAFVAAVWSASTPGGVVDIYAATSRDAGTTFSPPVRVNSTPGEARVNGEQPPRVAVTSHGTAAPVLTVVWTAAGTTGTKLLTATSVDGGRSFPVSKILPGSEAAGNRGWESIASGPDGRLFSAWLDHRGMSEPQENSVTAEHHHDSGGTTATSPQARTSMSELSRLYVGSIDGGIPARGITSGVCYCCKTAIAAGPDNTLSVVWRHVYADNLRDIAFAASRDGGLSFTPPVRVSEDHWQINGCPEDGPTLGVDPHGTVHVIWPTVVAENGGPVKALFHATTRDGRTFTPRTRLPISGQANHPQMAIGPDGTLMVVWEASGNGARRIGSMMGRTDATGRVRFTSTGSEPEQGRYPVVVSIGPGAWLRAWTAGDAATSQIRIVSDGPGRAPRHSAQ